MQSSEQGSARMNLSTAPFIGRWNPRNCRRDKMMGCNSLSARPHRPEAQDVALSRPKHGFESRWGRHPFTVSQTASSSRP